MWNTKTKKADECNARGRTQSHSGVSWTLHNLINCFSIDISATSSDQRRSAQVRDFVSLISQINRLLALMLFIAFLSLSPSLVRSASSFLNPSRRNKTKPLDLCWCVCEWLSFSRTFRVLFFRGKESKTKIMKCERTNEKQQEGGV